MNVCNLRFAILAFLAFSATGGFLSAQEDAGGIAYPAPRIPNDPNLLKVAQLRLWYVGEPGTSGITLVREAEGRPPEVIESGIQAGLFSPYVVQKPGKFKLHILDGNVARPADPEEPLPLEEKKLVEPIEVEMPPGSYQTLVVEQKDGKFTSQLTADVRPDSSSPPLVRVVDFSGLDGWRIQLANRENHPLQPVWDSGQGGTQPAAIGLTGIYRFVITRRGKEKPWPVASLETELARGTSMTVLLFPGEAGTGAATLFFNAVPGAGYHPEWVKKVAEDK